MPRWLTRLLASLEGKGERTLTPEETTAALARLREYAAQSPKLPTLSAIRRGEAKVPRYVQRPLPD